LTIRKVIYGGFIMKKLAEGSMPGFIGNICKIHGRYGDIVYRKKRNGKPWVYEYHYVPKYPATTLSKRTGYVVKMASKLSNPQHNGYGVIINKLFYYTPYFVYAGNYDFSCNTFFKIRKRGDYGIETGDTYLIMKLAPRSRYKMRFTEGEYTINCYNGSRLYSERKIVVIDETEDLESVYNAWWDEHLVEILQYPDIRIRSLHIYRRGVEPPWWLQYLVGKTDEAVLYRSSKVQNFMYVRSSFEHQHTAEGDYFYTAQTHVMACWSASAPEFRRVWEKYHIRWFDANYKKDWKIVRQHNLWSKLVFRAGGVLGFDLEEISPDNWLWGVETLGDLLEVCGMGVNGILNWYSFGTQNWYRFVSSFYPSFCNCHLA
jgi:hypothetical protein